MKKSRHEALIVGAVRKYHELGTTPSATLRHKMGKGMAARTSKLSAEHFTKIFRSIAALTIVASSKG